MFRNQNTLTYAYGAVHWLQLSISILSHLKRHKGNITKTMEKHDFRGQKVSWIRKSESLPRTMVRNALFSQIYSRFYILIINIIIIFILKEAGVFLF
jgi:hypothetical protein